jgi:type II secretory pathway component PulF
MFSSKMSLREASGFTRRLGTGLRAGVGLLRLFETEGGTGRSLYQQKLNNVLNSIREGKSLAEAMLAEGKYFPPLMIQMVHAGETAGGLDRILLHMADYYDDLRKTRANFLQKISWPCLQLILGLLVISGVILIQGLLAPNSSGPAFDASGLGLSGVKGFIIFWLIVGFVGGLLGVTGWGLWHNWFNCHARVLPLIQQIPVIGTPIQTLSLARFTMTLSMMLNAGVDAIRSVKQAFRSTGNYHLLSGMEKTLDSIKRGDTFSKSFSNGGVFPQDFLEMVEIGELSGTETESLDRLALEYHERGKSALTVIAMVASGVIWFIVSAMLVIMILRMALNYINLLNNPLG